MYLNFKKKWDNTKYLIASGFVLAFFLLIMLTYKNDEKVTKKSDLAKNYNITTDFETFKEFVLSKIKSPFINLHYEIKKGDTIQKILKKYKVQNTDIQTVIEQYKKYGNPNQLLVGNKIDIIIEKNYI